MISLEKLTKQVCSLAEETGHFLLKEVGRLSHEDIEVKGLHNFVTYVDKASENQIVEGLRQILPGSGFITEENETLKPAEYTWVIDPLDGTTNFIHGVPLFCISIGLLYQDKTVAAVVYEPNLREMFYTWNGAPSYKNNREIRVSQVAAVNGALFATGFPYYDYNRLEEYLEIFRHLLRNSHGARRLGSAAADLAYVACGRYDGFYEYGLSPWDVCAGALLVRNAGGVVADFSGGNNYIFGRQILATNNYIFDEFLKLFETWNQKSV